MESLSCSYDAFSTYFYFILFLFFFFFSILSKVDDVALVANLVKTSLVKRTRKSNNAFSPKSSIKLPNVLPRYPSN